MSKEYHFSRALLGGVVCALCVVVGIGVLVKVVAPKNFLTVAFLDVGQGDAIFIETPEGNQVLIDAGSGNAVVGQLGHVMGLFDRSIDVLIATHPDTDHIGGFSSVFDRYMVSAVIATDAVSESAPYGQFIKQVQREGSKRINPRRGTLMDLGGGVTFEVLYPIGSILGEEINDVSVIGILRFGSTSVLLTGDASQWVEQLLVEAYGDALDADVLKVGHHGSKTSTAPEFIAAVTPQVAIISAGARNRYGHPHQTTMDTLTHFAVPVIATADAGTIVFRSDGTSMWRVE
jgi:competence protein ComEC